jgi:hypothetical protein
MNYTVEICSALIENRKLRLISALADTVGINERECRAQLTSLCAEGTLRVDRDYVLINNEAKAKRVAKGAQPPTKDETARRGAHGSEREDRPGCQAVGSQAREASAGRCRPCRRIKIEKGIPIPRSAGAGSPRLVRGHSWRWRSATRSRFRCRRT